MRFSVELIKREWSRICVALTFYDHQFPNYHNAEIKERIYNVLGRATCIPLETPQEGAKLVPVSAVRKKGRGHEVTL